MSRQNTHGTWHTIRRLEKSIPQVKWYRGELMLMSLFINIFALGLPIFILQVYDRILPNLGLTTMQFLVIGLVVVMLLDFLMKTIRAAVTTYTGARFEHLARVSAVDHILRTPQDVYEQDTPGSYLDKVNAIGVVKDFYSSQLGTLFIDLPFAIFFLGMIWFLGGLMVAVPLTLLTLFGIMAIIVGGNLRRAVDTRGQVDNKRYDFIIEIIEGIHTVKAQAFKNLLQRRFETMQEMSARAVRSVAMQSSIAQGLGSTFGQLNMACVIGMGAILVIDGSLSAGELAACTLLSGRAMQPLQSAMGLWTNFQTIRVACDSASSVMELPAEDLRGKPDMPKIDGRIEFRTVNFGYADMDVPFIQNLNLDIGAGEMIGIDGDNSSGRSTLLKLMIGLIRPTQGQVMIDGHDLADHQTQSYRSQMAFLSADANVYTGTILDNMTYFRGGKYINRAMKLSKQLGLDEEIKRLPEGYGTHVGDGAGGVLPAGFAQRITIVRAMVDEPKIVFFDNANHGLDSNTDRILLDYIVSLKGKATVILVTGRPSWLRASDRQFLMSNGHLEPKPVEEPPQLEKPKEALPAPDTTAVEVADAAPTPEAENANPVETASPSKAIANAAEQAPPIAEPAARTAQPAKPEAKQAQPAEKPAARPAPAASSAQPVAKPAARPTQPAKPAAKQARPAAKPAVSPTQPAKPAAKQARPAAKPAVSPTQPAKSAAKQARTAAARPTQPAKPAAKQARTAAARPTQPAKPAAKQARPATKPVAKQAARPATTTKPTIAPTSQAQPARSRPPAPPPGNPANRQNAGANEQAQAPKPAATLRAAPSAASAATKKNSAVLKPKPPQAKRPQPAAPSVGGVE